SDGSFSGTVLVKDIAPDSTSDLVGEITVMNSILYFHGNEITHGAELWKSDGSTEGTVMVKDIAIGTAASSSPRQFTVIGSRLYFIASSIAHNDALWSSDGTEEGTFRIGAVAGVNYRVVDLVG